MVGKRQPSEIAQTLALAIFHRASLQGGSYPGTFLSSPLQTLGRFGVINIGLPGKCRTK
jgi:hypothetical protein